MAGPTRRLAGQGSPCRPCDPSGRARNPSTLTGAPSLVPSRDPDFGRDDRPVRSLRDPATIAATRSAWSGAKARGSGTPRGERYLDFFPGWGCNLLGHCPPRVVEAVREQVGQLIHVPNTWYIEAQGAVRPGALGAVVRRPVLLLQQRGGGQRGRDQAGPGARPRRRAGTRSSRWRAASTAGPTPRSRPPPSRSITPASSRWSPASPTSRTTTSKPLAAARRRPDRRRPGRADPGRGRDQPAGARLSRRAPQALRRAGRPADPRRGPDRHGPDRRVVRLPALRHRARHPHLRQGPGRRRGGGRDDREAGGRRRRSSRGCTPAPSAATRSPAGPGWRRSRRSRPTACSSAAGPSASGSAATSSDPGRDART